MMSVTNHSLEVWDPLIRLFHWSMFLAVTTAWWAEGRDLQLHILAGTVLGGLLMFRMIWGVIGERNALFTSFIPSRRALSSHLRALLVFRAEHYPAHTPLGSLMIYALLLTLLLLVCSGMALMGLQTGSGVFSGWADVEFSAEIIIQTLHGWCYTVLGVLVSLHLAGVLFESLLQHRNLVAAMISGKKVLPEDIYFKSLKNKENML